jgi:hypothetical protein
MGRRSANCHETTSPLAFPIVVSKNQNLKTATRQKEGDKHPSARWLPDASHLEKCAPQHPHIIQLMAASNSRMNILSLGSSCGEQLGERYRSRVPPSSVKKLFFFHLSNWTSTVRPNIPELNRGEEFTVLPARCYGALCEPLPSRCCWVCFTHKCSSQHTESD